MELFYQRYTNFLKKNIFIILKKYKYVFNFVAQAMKAYLDLLSHVYQYGAVKTDRTGIGTKSIFGYQFRHNLQEAFPLITTKKLHLKSIIYELLWFIKGETNIAYLKENGVSIWDEWADKNGELGPVYGKQWRSWAKSNGETVDQLSQLIQQIKTNPDSRRLIISAWNVADLPDMALSPCHCLFQFYVQNNRLSCQLYQRSADVFLGVPFNIASYALFTHMIAQVCGLEVGEFVHTFGDVHLYLNHVEQAEEQLKRKPFSLPRLWINPEIKHIEDFQFEDFKVLEYQSHPSIKAPIAV